MISNRPWLLSWMLLASCGSSDEGGANPLQQTPIIPDDSASGGTAGTSSNPNDPRSPESESPGGSQEEPIEVPPGLTPNGDGTYSDANGTRVRIRDGQLVDERGNLVVIGEDGLVRPARPELEVETSFRVPVVTGRLIWAANPASGRVALVDALTQEVQTLPAGLGPTYLAAIPGGGESHAIVINAGGHDCTLFREAAGGGIDSVDLPLHERATAWSIDPAGRFVIAWSDARDFTALDPTEGLQDVTVIDLAREPLEPLRFSVGYRPVKVQIDASASRAYAVTRDGISVIELGDAPRLLDDITIVSPEEELAADAGQPVLDDVPITPDGRFAIVRFDGAPRLKVIALGENRSQVLTLPSEVSDVDLSGSGARAVAVLRDSDRVAVFSPEAALADNQAVQLFTFEGETLGSASLPDQGDKALLFTNALPSDRLAILDLAAAAAPPRVVSLKAPITAVFPSPEGSHAVALLETALASERAGAFSIVPVNEALPPKIQGTDAPPFRVSMAETPLGVRGLVTTRDDGGGLHAAYLVRMPSLQVDRIELSSPPIAVGLLPEHGVGYVAQQHPEGRITFINLETAEPKTLTGFELSDRVVSGSTP